MGKHGTERMRQAVEGWIQILEGGKNWSSQFEVLRLQGGERGKEQVPRVYMWEYWGIAIMQGKHYPKID